MRHSISYLQLSGSCRYTPRPIRASGGRPCPFWCDVIDTRWSKAMRNHIVAAGLACGTGVPRTWRFYSQFQCDS
jgi:hypothetical protein